MSSFPKILKIIFVILILVIFGELVYYVYFQYSTKKDTHEDTNLTTTQVNIPTLMIQDQSKIASRRFKQVDEHIFSTLASKADKMIKNGIFVSSVVENSYYAEIKEINIDGGIEDNIPYKIKLRINVGNDDYADFLYNENALNRIKVSRLINGKEEEITLNDLKSGDSITLEIKTDLLKSINNNIIEVKIVKLT